MYEYMESVKRMPRVLLAGANSGCGKTSITCGILKALVNIVILPEEIVAILILFSQRDKICDIL